MGKKPKKELRYISFKEVPGFPAFIIFIAIWVVCLISLINLLFGHFRTFYLWLAPPLSLIRITTTLWTVQAYSNCVGIFATQRRICRRIVDHLQHVSLEDYSVLTCAYEGMLLQTVDLGCPSTELLRVGSWMFASGISFGIGIQIFGALATVVWWFKHRMLNLRKAIIILLSLAPFFELTGCCCYLMLIGLRMVQTTGNSLDLKALVGIDGSDTLKLPTADMDVGFFCALGVIIFSCVLPVACVPGLRKDCCLDWEDDPVEEEQQELLKDLEDYLLDGL